MASIIVIVVTTFCAVKLSDVKGNARRKRSVVGEGAVWLGVWGDKKSEQWHQHAVVYLQGVVSRRWGRSRGSPPQTPWWEGQAPEFSEFDSTSSWALPQAVCPCAQRPKHTGVTDILGIVDGLCSCLLCGRHVLPCYTPCSHCCSDPLCDGACWRRKLSAGLSMQTLLLAPRVASAVWAQWWWNVMGEEAESQEIKNQIQSHTES